jgi:hypothetical protein
MVSKTGSGFLNPVDSCLVETDSCPLAGLAHARIFCRCYSLVLNVANLEGTRLLAVMMPDVMLDVMPDVMLAATALLVSHTGLSCYMFAQAQTVGFSNFQRDMAAAISYVLHFLDSLSRIITCAEKKMTRQTHPVLNV